MSYLQIASLFLALLSVAMTVVAWQKSRRGQFYGDTLGLLPLGIYVWGDALVLGPFWVLASLLLAISPVIFALRFLVLFYVIRSAYEVLYWLTHQVAQRDYMPPLTRSISWMKPNDAAIIYQLFHTCVVILGLYGLWLTTLLD